MRTLAVAFSAALLTFAGCGNENAVVGGSCARGYFECNGACVDLLSDPNNCGLCENVCPAGRTCIEAICIGPGTDGGQFPDGSADGSTLDGSADGSTLDGSVSDGSTPDGSVSDGSITDATNDAFSCAFPLTNCGGVCRNLDTDPVNCGLCNRVCASGICASGNCVGASGGDIVVIGHDYGAPETAAQFRVLANAVFITDVQTVRVLSFEQFADAANVSRVKQQLSAYATAQGRGTLFTVSNAAADLAAPDLFAKYQVVLVYDQGSMDSVTANNAGAAAKLALGSFAKSGGTVVALDGARGLGNMPAFITQAGLWDVASHALLPAGTGRVSVVSPADVLSKGVVTPYATAARSVSFASNDPASATQIFVGLSGVSPAFGDPVILHKIAQ